jgi:hypothetical protein
MIQPSPYPDLDGYTSVSWRTGIPSIKVIQCRHMCRVDDRYTTVCFSTVPNYCHYCYQLFVSGDPLRPHEMFRHAVEQL